MVDITDAEQEYLKAFRAWAAKWLDQAAETPTPERSFDPDALLAGNLGEGRPWPEE